MARLPRAPSPPSPLSPGFDPVEEWLVDFDHSMAGELGTRSSDLGVGAVASGDPEPTDCGLGAGSDGSVLKRCDAVVKEEVGVEQGGCVGQFSSCGDFDVEIELKTGSSGLEGQFGSDQFKDSKISCGSALGIGDLLVKDVSEGLVDTEMKNVALVKEVEGGKGEQEEEGEEDKESSDEELESSDEEKEVESREESSSSEEEEKEQRGKKGSGCGGEESDEMKDDMHACLEDRELMAGSDEDDAPKGPIRSKHEVEVLPPVPKVEVQLEPHHQTLPVGTITAIMGERVIVEGSVQHNPLNEGSILWITESRMPLGIVDELFGPVKNPYYLVRYNSDQEVPPGISVGTAVSFVTEFADHILNIKELQTKGYDASGENDEELAEEPEFSDDEKEAEYRRSLRQAKRQTNDRQHESKKPFGNKKRTQPRGAGFRKDRLPMIPDAPTPGHQPKPRFHCSDMVPEVPDNAAFSSGPQNLSMSVPTLAPPVLMDPAMSSAVRLATQTGGCFINPSQQFLPQQPNMVWPNGLPPQRPQNMGVEGAAFAASILQNLLIGANQYQQQFQNQNFGGFQSRMPVPSPGPFMPTGGLPANLLLPGGQPVHSSFPAASPMPMGQGNFGPIPHASSPMPMGQGNFGPIPHASSPMPMGQGNFGQIQHATCNMQEQGPAGPPNVQGFGQAPLCHGDTEQPSIQFNSGPFNQRSSSSRGRRQHQRGGRHFFGRGGRHRNS